MSTFVSEHNHTLNPSVMGGEVGMAAEDEEVDEADELERGGSGLRRLRRRRVFFVD
jgi:hypothetical protein